jgi:Reverse transcriptase (RNA-dependent DNA polymerase)
LRQGDPLSPFIFNLVADTLSKILIKRQLEGYIQGLGNFNYFNIIHLQFADDILFFLKADERIIVALKLLLAGFENM